MVKETLIVPLPRLAARASERAFHVESMAKLPKSAAIPLYCLDSGRELHD